MGMELTKEKNDSIISRRCTTFPSYKNSTGDEIANVNLKVNMRPIHFYVVLPGSYRIW